MKKSWIIFLCILFSVLFASSFSSAKDIAYIYRQSVNIEHEYINTINELGFTYDLIQEDNIQKTNFSSYKAILIGDEIFSNPNNIPIYEHNSLIINSFYYYEKNGDPQWGWSKEKSTLTSPSQLKVNNINSSIINGIPSEFNGYTENSIGARTYILKGKKPTGITIGVYKRSGTIGDSAVAFVKPGTTMLNGKKTKGKSLYFGITTPNLWTSETKKMFKNSLKWLVMGEDLDKDGFFDNIDCNDLNASISPGAIEAPYDKIDQNCDGKDLNDVDEDGFIFIGVGGNDCNDIDASIYPGAIEIIDDKDQNCINDAPVLRSNISKLEFNEDTNFTIDLKNYFVDPDGDELFFSIKEISNPNIVARIIGSKVEFNSTKDWFGEAPIIFKASDGNLEKESNVIQIKVVNVNDVPILEFIENISVIIGKLIKIVPHATDIEGDNISFSYGTPFNNNGEWQTKSGDEGTKEVSISANDGNGGISTQKIIVNVIPKVLINEFSSSEEEWIELYNTGKVSVNLSGWTINNKDLVENHLDGLIIESNGFLVLEKNKDFNFELGDNEDIIIIKREGEEVDKVSYGDFDDGSISDNAPYPKEGESLGRYPDGRDSDSDKDDFAIFQYPTKKFPFNADLIPPEVNLLFPLNNESFNVREINFSFSVSDNYNNITCELFIDSKLIGTKKIILDNSFKEEKFDVVNIKDGEHIWNVICSDNFNEVSGIAKSFLLNAPDSPEIIKINDIVASENQLISFEVKAIDKDNNEIFYSVENLPEGAKFSGRIFSWTPSFEQAGDYDIKFIVEDSTGLKSSQSVKIKILDVKSPPKFSDASKCDIKSDKIESIIKSPGNGRSFKVGEILEVELEVKNKFDKKMDFDTEVHFYNLDDDKSENKKQKDIKIDSNEKEKLKFEIKIPENIDEKDNFLVYYFVESENNSCKSGFTKIKIKREKDVVKIKNFNIQPYFVSKGSNIYFFISVQNIGTEEQDVFIKLINEKLGLNITSEKFSLEEFDNSRHKKEKDFTFIIPENALEGEYEIEANVIFDNNVVSKSEKIYVIDEKKEGIVSHNNKEIEKIILIQSQDIIKLEKTGLVISGNDNKEISNSGELVLIPDNFRHESEINIKNKKSLAEKAEIENFRGEINGGLLSLNQFGSSLEEINDPILKKLIIILNTLLIIGIIISIIKIIIFIRK
ncbi:MAG: MopE-related protein [Candidatus Pacearchaeota archaeon]